MTIRRAYVDSTLGQLHYAEAGIGRSIIMLHQAPRSLDEFAEVQQDLSRDFHTIAMDMPGFGMSAAAPIPQTIEYMAAGVIALLDGIGIDSAALLGHHTGAVVALEVAAAHPNRVEALVLSGMPWIGPERRARGVSVGVDEAEVAEDGRHLLEFWLQRQPYYPPGRPDLLNRFIRDALVPGIDPTQGHQACDRYLMDERIGQVRCPVLVLEATEDPFTAPAVPQLVVSLTGATLVETARLDGGMIPAMEQCSESVSEHLRTFLSSDPADASTRDETQA